MDSLDSVETAVIKGDMALPPRLLILTVVAKPLIPGVFPPIIVRR